MEYFPTILVIKKPRLSGEIKLNYYSYEKILLNQWCLPVPAKAFALFIIPYRIHIGVLPQLAQKILYTLQNRVAI
jgi:hypothetical protein